VRTKNMLSVLMQVFVTFSLISVLWVIYGYSLAFTEGGSFFGVLDKVFLKGITVDSVAATFSKGVVISELAYVIFQGAFAAITCGLIVGAFAERAKFAAILVFMVIWFTLSYCRWRTWCGTGQVRTPISTRLLARQPPRRPASCSRKAHSTSPAAPWCTSTPPSPVWSARSSSASGSATAANRWLRTA
jgi:uncharacterized protein with PQ loop repeat